MEILTIKLGKNNNIRGVEIVSVEVKVSQYCDAMTSFLSDEPVGSALNTSKEFRHKSGLEINVSRSSLMRLEPTRHKTVPIRGIVPSAKVKFGGSGLVSIALVATNMLSQLNT